MRFLADLPANKAAVLQFDVKAKAGTNSNINKTAGKGMTATVEKVADGFRVDTGCLKYEVANHCGSIFKELDDGRKIYKAADFEGPYLRMVTEIPMICRLIHGAWWKQVRSV